MNYYIEIRQLGTGDFVASLDYQKKELSLIVAGAFKLAGGFVINVVDGSGKKHYTRVGKLTHEVK